MSKRPPLGVKPWYVWDEENPSPTLQQLVERYKAVDAAVCRYRKADMRPTHPRYWREWLRELGVC